MKFRRKIRGVKDIEIYKSRVLFVEYKYKSININWYVKGLTTVIVYTQK